MRGGKRSKEEEEGPLLHAPLPPKGVLRCLRSSGLTVVPQKLRGRKWRRKRGCVADPSTPTGSTAEAKRERRNRSPIEANPAKARREEKRRSARDCVKATAMRKQRRLKRLIRGASGEATPCRRGRMPTTGMRMNDIEGRKKMTTFCMRSETTG